MVIITYLFFQTRHWKKVASGCVSFSLNFSLNSTSIFSCCPPMDFIFHQYPLNNFIKLNFGNFSSLFKHKTKENRPQEKTFPFSLISWNDHLMQSHFKWKVSFPFTAEEILAHLNANAKKGVFSVNNGSLRNEKGDCSLLSTQCLSFTSHTYTPTQSKKGI